MRRSRRSVWASGERNTPSQLSGGQQQRVAIARALINVPGMILADEPTGNLDSRTSNEIMELLRALNREHGVTIVVVTHEPVIAAYTDRIVTMRDGLVVSDAPVRHDDAAAPPRAAIATRLGAPHATRPARRLRGCGVSWAFALMVLVAAAQAIMRNKLRAILTMLGVFIGVAALIAMVAVGQGANAAVEKEIESLGTNLLVVLPGATTSSGVRGGHGSASTLTVEDARAIPGDAPAVERVSYMVRQMGQVQYENQNWTTTCRASRRSTWGSPTGRSPRGAASRTQISRAPRSSCSSARPWLQQLFGGHEDPVGATILVKGFPLRVDRGAGRQGPERLRPGPGRSRDDPLHDGGEQGAGRGGAEPGAERQQPAVPARRPTRSA